MPPKRGKKRIKNRIRASKRPLIAAPFTVVYQI
jgi:hypothetical protein